MLYANYRMVCFWLCDVWYFPTLTALRNIAYPYLLLRNLRLLFYGHFLLKNILCGLFP